VLDVYAAASRSRMKRARLLAADGEGEPVEPARRRARVAPSGQDGGGGSQDEFRNWLLRCLALGKLTYRDVSVAAHSVRGHDLQAPMPTLLQHKHPRLF